MKQEAKVKASSICKKIGETLMFAVDETYLPCQNTGHEMVLRNQSE